MRWLLSELLRQEGFAVRAFPDGAPLIAALEALARDGSVPDLIVSDVHMPGQGGIAVVMAARRLGFAVPIILVTAFEDDETHQAVRRLGCAAVLDKPFDVRELR